MSAITIVAPTGVAKIMEINIPRIAQTTLMILEEITTALKLLNTLMLDIAGNTTSAAVSKEPTNLIDRAITIPITAASAISYALAFSPVAVMKAESKVIENILL